MMLRNSFLLPLDGRFAVRRSREMDTTLATPRLASERSERRDGFGERRPALMNLHQTVQVNFHIKEAKAF
jgi:hypothetical protein